MKSLKIIIVITTLLLLPVSAVACDDYLKEIEEYVIDVCWRESLKNTGVFDIMEEDAALLLLKITQKEQVETLSNAVSTIVTKVDNLSQRKIIYRMMADICISGAE
ncbi:MAG: hypothetical protein O7D86_03385 [Proteobacteria bacterium]|nr:hypothetical protein [Pseudomonadota bacterium]